MYKSKIMALSLMGLIGFSSIGCATNTMQSTTAHVAAQKPLNTQDLMAHLSVLETIAKEHGGNRAIGTEGGLLTAKYIDAYVRELGLDTSKLIFENRNKLVGQNLIVEIPGQSKDTAIIVGGHYDSVKMGPGINDNGSGVAVLLELIKYYAMQKEKPKHTLYFAFWDSEEDGIGGSTDFVKNLSPNQLQGIQAYINLDMVGTKDPTIQIADGDQSSIDEMEKTLKERGLKEADYKPLIQTLRSVKNHPQDIVLENHLRTFFAAKKLEIKDDSSTLNASDTAPFLAKVPVASFIFFNEQLKGEELEFAPCYHKACDTMQHVDPKSMQLAGEATQYLIKVLNQ
jgi:aminopeptidase S